MCHRPILPMCVALMMAVVWGAPAEGASVWREGEQPDRATMQGHGWYDSVKHDQLSGGDWLSNFSENSGSATYVLTLPETGDYALWVRANPTKATLRWRLNDRQWADVPLDRARHRRNIAADGAPDLRYIAWVRLGRERLAEGKHTLRFRFVSENKHHGAIDAIYLTTEGRTPVGKHNPADAADQHAPGYFAWTPGRDPLTGEAPIDLRRLNERVAGMNGCVRREGDRFVLGSGQPVRFWAVQGGLGAAPDRFDRRARHLAKYGVNLVRLGGLEFFRDWRDDKASFRDRLDTLHAKVAALKQHGIYVYLDHLYWHTHTKISDDIYPGFGEGEAAIALLFFSEEFQKTYVRFLNDLLTADNPYTDVSLANDPAVAFIELQNESSLLFWTFKPRDFPDPERKLVERHFARFLENKYGSLQKAVRAWGDNPRKGNPTPDALDAGRVGLYAAGRLTGQDWAVNQRNAARAADQLQFMVEAQRGFYEKMRRTLRDRIGTRALIVPSNWKTADPRVLDGLERYTYTAGDVIARNSYFGPAYKEGGQQRFYAIEAGDTYRSRSALKAPNAPAPLATPQIAGYPFMVTENNWTRPNRYRVEWPLTVAAYAAMTGVDGWTFFTKQDTDWRHIMGVWDVSNPSVLGQFPAAALMYRRGDVTQPNRPAALERVSFDQAYAMQGTRTVPLRGGDALWQARLEAREKQAGDTPDKAVDPLAHFVGPVQQQFDEKAAALQTVDIEAHIDREAQIVRSMTGQLRWNAGAGVVRVDTQRAQGAWGFLGAVGPIELSDVTIDSDNAYGAVVAVSLDDKPLRESDRVLIQTGTWDRPYGFETEAAGEYERITNLGGYPLNVRRIKAKITLHTQGETAIALDGNGQLTERRVDARRDGQRLRITLPEDAIYTIVR
jgi:hypothetical protein